MAAIPTKTIWVTLPTPYEPSPEELAEKYGIDRDLVVGTIRGPGRWIKKRTYQRDKAGKLIYSDPESTTPLIDEEGHGEFAFGFQVIGRPDPVAVAASRATGPYIDTDDIEF